MRKAFSLGWPLLFAGLLFPGRSSPGQSRVVAVPGSLSGSEGRTFLETPFSFGPSRTQVILDKALLGGLGSKALVTALAFRPDGGGTFAAKTLSLEVLLSTAAAAPGAPSGDYAANRGKDAVTVLPRTNLSLPNAFKPFTPPSGIRFWIRFSKSFSWKGGGLCLEVADYSSTKSAWRVDAASAVPYGFGRVSYEGAPCPLGRNRIVSSVIPWPGAPVEWKTRLLDGSASTGSALLLLGTGRSKWGGLTLPWNMDPVLGTKGCRLYTDVALGLAAVLSSGKAQVDMGLLPANPVFSRAVLTAQWIVPGGSVPGGVGASGLARIRVGSAPPFVTLYNYLSNSNPNSPKAEFLAASAPALFLEVR